MSIASILIVGVRGPIVGVRMTRLSSPVGSLARRPYPRIRIWISFSTSKEFRACRRRTGTPPSTVQASLLPLPTPMDVTARANGNAAAWPTGEDMELEEGCFLEGVTGPILLKLLPGDSGSVNLLEGKGITGC